MESSQDLAYLVQTLQGADSNSGELSEIFNTVRAGHPLYADGVRLSKGSELQDTALLHSNLV